MKTNRNFEFRQLVVYRRQKGGTKASGGFHMQQRNATRSQQGFTLTVTSSCSVSAVQHFIAEKRR